MVKKKKLADGPPIVAKCPDCKFIAYSRYAVKTHICAHRPMPRPFSSSSKGG